MRITTGQILIVVIAVILIITVLNLLGGFSQPDLLVSMHPLTKPLVHSVLILHVDVFNMGSGTAKGCEIDFWPYGHSLSNEKVSTWNQKLDYASWREAFIHFPYVYNKTGIFDTSLLVKCDNYASQEIHYTIKVV